MSDQAAGNINIVLSVNKANYTAAMAEAQRQLDVFAGKAKGAGHATVSSMQASSAAIRELRDPLGNNQRAVERFITTIPGVGQALKAAFPLIGGLAFAGMIVDIGAKVVEFVKKANAMPEALRMGFAALSLEQKTSIDSLDVMTDKLNEAHAAFEHKPGDGTKTAIDEAKEAADKFAASVVAANAKVDELLNKNSSGLLSALFLMKPMTGEEESAFKQYQKVQDHNAYNLANAEPGSDAAKAAQKSMTDTRNGFIADRERALPAQNVQGGAVQAGAEGVLAALKNEAALELAQTNNAAAEGQAAKDEAAKKAAAQAKEAAAKQIQAMVAGLNALKLQYNMSIKAEYDYWDARRNALAKGSDTVKEAIVAKQAELAVAGARAAHEGIVKLQESLKRDSSESTPDWQKPMDEWNKAASESRTQKNIDANNASIDYARDSEKSKEADLQEKLGRTLTRFAYALDVAANHTEAYNTERAALQDTVNARTPAGTGVDATPEAQRELAAAVKALNDLEAQRGIQIRQDNVAENGPVQSTYKTGFLDAIQDFVQASREAADQMKELVTSTLNSLNAQLLNGMMGKRADFREFGSGVFKDVAGASLKKGEGSLLSSAMSHLSGRAKVAIGTTRAAPMYVQEVSQDAQNKALASLREKGQQLLREGKSSGDPLMDLAAKYNAAAPKDKPAIEAQMDAMQAARNATNAATTPSTTPAPTSTMGKIGGIFGGLLKAVLPGFASGGYMDGPSIVGEHGPEILDAKGYVTPNHKLSFAGGGGDIHFHPGAIDARGSTDPAQVDAAVQRGIRRAAPHLMAGSVKANRESQMRRPSRG